MSTDKQIIPQAGTGNSGESRPSTAGRPMDSGGDNQATEATHRLISIGNDEELPPWRPMPKKKNTTTSSPRAETTKKS